MALEKTKLDKTRDYGLIYGDPRFSYEQDGIHYGPDEQAVEQWSTLDKIAQERALALRRKKREDELTRLRASQQRLVKE
jgi:hypothetical protein